MERFTIDSDAIAASRSRAASAAEAGRGAELFSRVEVGDGLDDEGIATLLLADDVATERLLALARRTPDPPHLETFSPLYLSNECDAECAMCGMRRGNRHLVRETADEKTIDDQLAILHRRGLRGVALVTGEYHFGTKRRAMLDLARRALETALEIGFRHVLLNVGSLDVGEHEEMLENVPRRPDGRLARHVTTSTFQETYHEDRYRRFIGANPVNPRSDFERRLQNFDRATDAGMTSANPGVLLGLNPDVAFELLALLAHVRHLQRRGNVVYVSLPRLRKATGTEHRGGVSDDALYRVAALLGIGVPDARVVISTRETPEVQRRLLPVIHVLTPGSPGVAPYTETGARFDLRASQFKVLDERPIEEILGELLAEGARIECYEPRAVEP
jgi:2-iminoacetate synthase